MVSFQPPLKNFISSYLYEHTHAARSDDIKWASVRWRQEIRLLFALQDQKFVAFNINQLNSPLLFDLAKN